MNTMYWIDFVANMIFHLTILPKQMSVHYKRKTALKRQNLVFMSKLLKEHKEVYHLARLDSSQSENRKSACCCNIVVQMVTREQHVVCCVVMIVN